MTKTCMQFSWKIIVAEFLESHKYRDPRGITELQLKASTFTWTCVWQISLKYLLLIDIFILKDVQIIKIEKAYNRSV